MAHKAAVSLQEAQTMLAELDLKCHLDGLSGEKLDPWVVFRPRTGDYTKSHP